MTTEQMTLFPSAPDMRAIFWEAFDLLEDGVRPFSCRVSRFDGSPVQEPPEPGSHEALVDAKMRQILARRAAEAAPDTRPLTDEPF